MSCTPAEADITLFVTPEWLLSLRDRGRNFSVVSVSIHIVTMQRTHSLRNFTDDLSSNLAHFPCNSCCVCKDINWSLCHNLYPFPRIINGLAYSSTKIIKAITYKISCIWKSISYSIKSITNPVKIPEPIDFGKASLTFTSGRVTCNFLLVEFRKEVTLLFKAKSAILVRVSLVPHSLNLVRGNSNTLHNAGEVVKVKVLNRVCSLEN